MKTLGASSPELPLNSSGEKLQAPSDSSDKRLQWRIVGCDGQSCRGAQRVSAEQDRRRQSRRQEEPGPSQVACAGQDLARPRRRGHRAADRRRAHRGARRAGARARRRADRRLSRAAVRQYRAGCGAAARIRATDAVPARPLADAHQAPRAENRRVGIVSRPDHRGARRGRRILHAERPASARRRQGTRAEADHGAHLARRGAGVSYPRAQHGESAQPQGSQPRGHPDGARPGAPRAAREGKRLRRPFRIARVPDARRAVREGRPFRRRRVRLVPAGKWIASPTVRWP